MIKKIRIRAQVQYELERLLGVGGNGEVYSAWRFADDSSPRQRVALKIVNASFDSEQLAQLHNEARIISGIKSPHIVQVLGIEKISEGEFALVMELVEGVTLSSWLKNIPKDLRPELFWKLGLHLLTGLSELHSRNIVHGDLSPRNTLISTKGVAKIVDFGLSTLRSSQDVSPARGTPGYLSPMRLKGQSALPQDDLFALGCLLYECLLGEKLFSNPKMLGFEEIQHILANDQRLKILSPEIELINKLLDTNQSGFVLTSEGLEKVRARFSNFPSLPVFSSENTETLHLPRPLPRQTKTSALKKMSAACLWLLICGVPSITNTSVAIPAKVLGSAVLNAKPWAYVILDGQRLGETPVAVSKLRAGFHRVDFVGGEQRKTIWFEVYPKTSARITHKF